MSNVSVTLDLDTTAAEAKLADFQNEVNKLDKESKRVMSEVIRDINKTMRIIYGIISLARNIIKALGISLEPLYEAILQSALQAASTLLSIGIAYLAAPGLWWVYGIIAGAALGMSIGANMAVAQTKETNRERIDSIIASLNSLASITMMGFR